jgi:hypothetical protein
MNIGTVGILVVLAAFVLLLIINPNMSCFGRKIKSPFYPLFRMKKRRREGEEAKKPPKTEDYGFR